jgi:hypothetical protein
MMKNWLSLIPYFLAGGLLVLARTAGAAAPQDLMSLFLGENGADTGQAKIRLSQTLRSIAPQLQVRAAESHARVLSTGIDAEPMRGKDVELRIRLRVHAAHGQPFGVWLRTDVPGGSLRIAGTRELMPSAHEQQVVARLHVDAAAGKLRVGLDLPTGGKAILTQATLQILGERAFAVEDGGTQALSDEARGQLQGFAQALALVRYFSPSLNTTRVDWNTVARDGAKTMVAPMSAQAYAGKLRAILGPYAADAQWLTATDPDPAVPVLASAPFAMRRGHRGFGTRHAFYRSWWEYASVDGAGPAWQADFVQQPLHAGVRLYLPLATRTQQAPVIGMHPDPGEVLTRDGKLPVERIEPEFGPMDRYARLAGVMQLWGALRYFFPYSDVVPIDWNAALGDALRQAATSADASTYYETLSGLTTVLRDDHAWIRADLAQRDREWVPPLRLALQNGHAYAVPRLTEAGEVCAAPAIPAGSEVLTIDGQTIERRRQAIMAIHRTGTDTAQRHYDEDRLLAGMAAQPARLEYRASDGVAHGIGLSRTLKSYELSCPAGKPALYALAPQVWYVDLDRVNDKDMTQAMPQLLAANAIIFDVRNYVNIRPTLLGHLSATELVGPRTDIAWLHRPDHPEWESLQARIAPQSPRLTAKAYFLVGGRTISYAETYVQIVKHYRLGTVIGERTAGSNGDIATMALSGGYTAYWTGLRVLWQDGARFHAQGVEPDITVVPTLNGLVQGRDEVLEAALTRAMTD